MKNRKRTCLDCYMWAFHRQPEPEQFKAFGYVIEKPVPAWGHCELSAFSPELIQGEAIDSLIYTRATHGCNEWRSTP